MDTLNNTILDVASFNDYLYRCDNATFVARKCHFERKLIAILGQNWIFIKVFLEILMISY